MRVNFVRPTKTTSNVEWFLCIMLLSVGPPHLLEINFTSFLTLKMEAARYSET
jgi:hypothetical protein